MEFTLKYRARIVIKAISPYLSKDKKVLDVGSGAGLPGIPIAIACPDKTVHLLDSRLKRVVFLRHCLAELGLKNSAVLWLRLKDYQADELYPAVIARAFCAPELFFIQKAYIY